MKTLYVSDLDGTLLNDNQEVSENSADMINRLIKNGMNFTFATARSFSTASMVTKRLKLSTPVIVYNGCAIVDSLTGALIHGVEFSTEEKDYVMLKLLKHDISPFVYAYINSVEKVSFNRDRINDGQNAYLKSRNGDRRLNSTSAEKIYDGNIFYFTIIGEEQELLPLFNEISGDNRFYITFQLDRDFGVFWLEIMPKGASKAKAIQKLKEILGYEKIVCFGDAINDIPMFEISDQSYAVENSVEKLKVMSTQVIGSNNNDAVATKLLELFNFENKKIN